MEAVLVPIYSTSSASSGNATQLQGRPVSATGPSAGHTLVWSGSAWVPSTGTPGPTGPAGVDGTKWYSGPGAPSGTFGNSGDYWLNSTSGVLFGPKLSGAWGGGLQLQSGPQGPTGVTGPAGTNGTNGVTGPSGAIGATGPKTSSWTISLPWSGLVMSVGWK